MLQRVMFEFRPVPECLSSICKVLCSISSTRGGGGAGGEGRGGGGEGGERGEKSGPTVGGHYYKA